MLTWIRDNILPILIIIIMIALLGMVCVVLNECHNNPRKERIELVSEGILVNMRFMGTWYSTTELKFDDGSMTVVPYWLSRELRVGRKYKIWCSSKFGWRHREIKDGTEREE